MDTCVFPEIFGNDYNYTICQNSENITVGHLLDHMVGAWPTLTRAEDPMFSRVELSHKILIQSVLYETKLDDEVGESYTYSNFGYCLLGRVIEKVTQKTYVNYIRDKFQVDVRVAGGPANKLLSNETYYYSQNQDDCFSMPLTRMDSCAGLIISP
jgi:hypothetical protein